MEFSKPLFTGGGTADISLLQNVRTGPGTTQPPSYCVLMFAPDGKSVRA
jgi:hypothetical protein